MLRGKTVPGIYFLFSKELWVKERLITRLLYLLHYSLPSYYLFLNGLPKNLIQCCCLKFSCGYSFFFSHMASTSGLNLFLITSIENKKKSPRLCGDLFLFVQQTELFNNYFPY